MIIDAGDIAGGRLRQAIRARMRMDEARAVRGLLADGGFERDAQARIARTARRLVRAIRQPPQGSRRNRELPSRIRPVEPRGRGADVPRRSAPAYSRQRHRRPPDPREDRLRRMAAPSRPQRIAAGQRLHLGADADRRLRAVGHARARPVRAAGPAGGALGRARGARGGARRHAHHRPPVRHGPHHRRSPRPCPRRRPATATPSTCWARRR